VQTHVSPSSHSTYGTMLKYARPSLGNIRLRKLRPDDIAHAYATMTQSGYRRRKGGLAAKSVTLLHRVLRQALQQAVKWKLLTTNPADAVEPPRLEKMPVRVLNADATLALMETTRATELFPIILLAAMTGMRRGELAALRWQAINFEAGQLAVTASVEQIGRASREKPPKSERARTVALPGLLVEELRRYRIVQAEQLLRLGVRQSDAMHVCLRADGSPWLPSLISAAFVRLLKANGLPHMRLHELRHAHASHLLAANIHPKVVQERLGHASIRITLDLYSHTVPGMQEQAAASIDDLMQAAQQRRVAKR
jgi:integrase